MTHVLIIGMSHVTALARAVEELGRHAGSVEYDVVNLRRSPDIFDDKSKSFRLERRAWRRPDVVCLALEGNQHNIFSLLHTKQTFRLGDALLGSVPPGGSAVSADPARGVPFVPRDMLKAEFKRRLGRLDMFTQIIQGFFAPARFVHICAPPPVFAMPPMPPPEDRSEDFNIMLYYLDFDACPPDLRLKIHALQTEIFMDVAARHGAEFLAPPEQACGPDGFLDFACWDRDPTHGNSRYGRLVLAQIEAFIAQEVTA